MNKERYLDELLSRESFRFNPLSVSGIDNEPVARIFSNEVLKQEICLFARGFETGNDYLEWLHGRLTRALRDKQPLPVVRFADGEYAFYNYTLGCNGLYRQAESVPVIRQVMPLHVAALRYVADTGLLAPLVYPENSHRLPSRLSSLFKKKPDTGGADFLDFLRLQGVRLQAGNYVPFYATYAYLSSADFARAMDGRNLVILNSDFNETSVHVWFERFGSRPNIFFVEIPAEYVATRWENIKDGICDRIPGDTDLCLTGAGVGALLICADVAQKFSIPALDAGHVLNMMNDRVDKSNGARLYTIRKKP